MQPSDPVPVKNGMVPDGVMSSRRWPLFSSSGECHFPRVVHMGNTTRACALYCTRNSHWWCSPVPIAHALLPEMILPLSDLQLRRKKRTCMWYQGLVDRALTISCTYSIYVLLRCTAYVYNMYVSSAYPLLLSILQLPKYISPAWSCPILLPALI